MIFDALQREDTDEDDLRAHIEGGHRRHETGIAAPAGVVEPSEADRISPPDATRTVEAVRKQFDYVVVDTPPQLNESVLWRRLTRPPTCCTMATLDLPSVPHHERVPQHAGAPEDSDRQTSSSFSQSRTDAVGIDIEQVTRCSRRIPGRAALRQRSEPLDQPGMPVMAASAQSETGSWLMTFGMKPRFRRYCSPGSRRLLAPGRRRGTFSGRKRS